jgi:hypothetical protein
VSWLIKGGPPAVFLTFCLAGSIFYSLLRYHGMRALIFSVFIVTLLHLLIYKVTEPVYFLHFFLYYAALGATVYLYDRHIAPSMKRVKIGKFILFAVLLILIYTVLTLILSIFFRDRSLSETLMGIVKVHSFVGGGVGLGFELSELIAPREAG